MQIQPYLAFEGRCDEAIAFYRGALGAEVTQLMRYKDFPCDPDSKMPAPSPESAEKVMHAAMRIGDTTIFLSDGSCGGKSAFHGITLALTLGSDADARKYFSALANDGNISMPLTKTFFSSQFGMVRDRFGVTWMVLVAH